MLESPPEWKPFLNSVVLKGPNQSFVGPEPMDLFEDATGARSGAVRRPAGPAPAGRAIPNADQHQRSLVPNERCGTVCGSAVPVIFWDLEMY